MWFARQIPLRARPLVTALEKFRSDHGHYPGALTRLVPRYLPRVPDAGVLGHREFEYTRADPQDQMGRGAWLADWHAGYDLRLPCPWGFLNFDSMHYWPSGQYPKQAWGGVIEEIGGWAYVHE